MTKLEQSLFEVGLNAALEHPKARLWARANSAANFELVISYFIQNAIFDDILLLETDSEMKWMNEMCRNNSKKLNLFISEIVKEAHLRLTCG